MKRFIVLIISLLASMAYANIIHSVNVITPGNTKTEVYLWLDIGNLKDGICDLEYIIQPTISMMLQTGDSVPVDGDEIIRLLGPGYTCATINFQRSEKPAVSQYFVLLNNENNTGYIGSEPGKGSVVIE